MAETPGHGIPPWPEIELKISAYRATPDRLEPCINRVRESAHRREGHGYMYTLVPRSQTVCRMHVRSINREAENFDQGFNGESCGVDIEANVRPGTSLGR